MLNAQVRRQPNKIRKPCSTEESTKNYLRLDERQIEELGMEFNTWRGAGPRGIAKSEQMVMTLLDYVAGGGYYRQVGRSGGLSTSAAFRHTHLVADFLFDIARHHIQLPQHDEMQRLSSELRYPDGEVKNAILYIDGYIARIQRPDHAGNAYFCGRHGKSCDSLNTQYITDQFGKVRHIITGLPGSTHDKTATEWSRTFMDFLDNLPDGYITIGDPAYRNLHRNVGHRFMGHGLTDEQQQFNDDITRLRQVIERTIGATQLKWRMAQMKENRLPAKGGIIFASKLIVSMAVLHNRYTNYL